MDDVLKQKATTKLEMYQAIEIEYLNKKVDMLEKYNERLNKMIEDNIKFLRELTEIKDQEIQSRSVQDESSMANEP